MSRPSEFYALAWPQRAFIGAVVGAAALSIPTAILVLLTVTGERYQTSRYGVEQDMWVVCVLYPLGAALGGAIASSLLPFVRRAWQAALLGFATILPVYALVTVADDPRGPQPYTVDWGAALLCAVLVGAPAGLLIYANGGRKRRKRHRSRAARRRAAS